MGADKYVKPEGTTDIDNTEVTTETPAQTDTGAAPNNDLEELVTA